MDKLIQVYDHIHRLEERIERLERIVNKTDYYETGGTTASFDTFDIGDIDE